MFDVHNCIVGLIMNLKEQQAFVDAFDNSFCNLDKRIVTQFVYDYVNKHSLEHFNMHPTSSIIDALNVKSYSK